MINDCIVLVKVAVRQVKDSSFVAKTPPIPLASPCMGHALGHVPLDLQQFFSMYFDLSDSDIRRQSPYVHTP